MKKYFLIIALLILMTGIAYISGTGSSNIKDVDQRTIKNTSITTREVAKPDDDDCCKVVNSTTTNYSDMSLYQSDGNWTDQNGTKIDLGKFKNKKVVIAMFFASCMSACPVIVNDMKRIEAKIPKNKLSNYRFVLVSIDPERDTPQVLKKYAEERSLNYERWTLLTGSKDDIMELGMMLGFKYSKNENGGFTHTNLISFLNRKGEIIYQNDGLELDMNSVTKTIASLN
ncbi:MAG TPA: SCO family protein [Draconibacterium sp.]|nr:SCO family protein [Draconibacterium sp.]